MATITLRPSADGTTTGWTRVAASGTFASKIVDDPDSNDADTSYVQSPNAASGTMFVELDDVPADFNPAAINSISIKVAHRRLNTPVMAVDAGTVNARLTRADETTAISTTPTPIASPIQAGYQSDTLTPSPTGTHTVADWNGARLALVFAHTSNQTIDTVNQIRITAVEVTIDYTPASVGATIGIAAETDSASSLTPSKALAIGQPSETDAAQSFTASHMLALGLPVDTETALSIIPSKSAALGLAEETDSGLSITGSTATPAFILSASSNITASGEDTTAILTAPAGKTTADFGGGRIQDDENPGDAADIGTDEYREDEWCLEATASAELGEDYEFRVVRSDGTLLNTYTETPIWTVSVGIIQAIGIASETDSGQSITPSKALAFGLASETDSAQSVAASKSAAVGLADETDSAQPIIASKSRAIGIAEEADSAFALTVMKSAAIGQATETDSAHSVTASKARAIGLADETDSALSITLLVAGQIGQADETDSAQSITPSKARAIGLASETDSGLGIAAAKQQAIGIAEETDSALDIVGEVQGGQFISVGQAVETDTAFAITPSKAKAIGLATETDTAVSISPMKAIGLGIASELDEAFAMVAGKSQTIGLANELDTALALIVSGGAPIIVFGITRMAGIYLTRPGMSGISVSRSRMTGITVEPEGS